MTQTLTPDQLAAHKLLTQLRTRIATQPLPYQYGIEARALESLWEVFDFARKAMNDHPGCSAFAQITTNMLNVDLRPLTAKWHRAHHAGILNSRDGANEFRVDLRNLQPKLAKFALDLQEMAYGTRIEDEVTPPVIPDTEIIECFFPILYGIDKSDLVQEAEAINASEAAEVGSRRGKYGIKTPAGTNAVGLALSGGGIRSATFCLGVVQVLVDRGLMKDIDFLSTVSGGGYTGSFITSCVGSGNSYDEIGCPHGPDTRSIKYVRLNAKYLSADDLKQRWQMVVTSIAGLVLNWTAPVAVLALLALASNEVKEYVAVEWWLWVAGLLGIATVLLMMAYGISLRVEGARERRPGLLAWAAAAALAVLALFVIERGFGLFRWAYYSAGSVSGLVAAAVISAPAIVRYLPLVDRPALRAAVFKAMLWSAGVVVPLLAITCMYAFRELGYQQADPTLSPWHPLHYVGGTTLLGAIFAICALYAFFSLNINLTGPHKLYRDQLTKTFIHGESRGVAPLLSSVNDKSAAPYHLLNAAVNLPSSQSVALRDRRADFFLFSKHWSGSPSVRYHKTSEWSSNGEQIDLGTAMAISGAAISSHMGLASMPSLSTLLSILNLRLGFWVARPGVKTLKAPGFLCLMREITATGMSEDKNWVNLSDGGHIENMGVYELLRRRCKFIICVDGEADPESTFAGQLTLVRHAQIDLGVRIEPRLDDIRQDSTSKYSRTHAQLFRIHYPSANDGRASAIGLMLYLKLSLTGNEAELLKRYRSMHPEFPHQSTIDQFFDEEQFEVYRQLGVHVGQGVFSPALLTSNSRPENVEEWFRQLAANLLEPAN